MMGVEVRLYGAVMEAEECDWCAVTQGSRKNFRVCREWSCVGEV
jgi:hypothetical protein